MADEEGKELSREELLELDHINAQERYRRLAVGALKVDIELGVPIKVDGSERSSITMRRPRAGDLLRMKKQKYEGLDPEAPESARNAVEEAWLIARLADISPEDMEGLDLSDWDICQAVLFGFRGARVSND